MIPPPPRQERAFTLVEVMVASAVLLLLLVMLFSMTSQTTATVTRASAKIDSFQAARTAFDTISQRISQTTMNTYWDYYNSANQRRDPTQTSGSTAPANFVPATYGRASDLHFLVQANPHYGQAVYFAAPEGVSADITKDQAAGLLNAFGYFVQYGGDANYLPAPLSKQKYRYRLMQSVQPTENFQIYLSGTTSTWVTTPNGGVQGNAWPLADNVIALVIWPRESLVQDSSGTAVTNNYQYDSRALPAGLAAGSFPIQYAQAPPAVQITMVAIDEASAVRLDTGTSTEPSVISAALSGTSTSLFTNIPSYQTDLAALQTALSNAHINYEVLSTTVNLRESKWNNQ